MKKRILKVSDENIAGFKWSYSFWLEQGDDSSYCLSFTQSPRSSEPVGISPVSGLRSGQALYEELDAMCGEVDCNLANMGIDEIVEILQDYDPVIAAQFQEAHHAAVGLPDDIPQSPRETALKRLDGALERYLERYNTLSRKNAGSARIYHSERQQVRQFIHDYYLEHGVLPTGTHTIPLPPGPDKSYDFSDLATQVS